MNNAFKNFIIFIILICGLNLAKTETDDPTKISAKENPNIFFSQVFLLKDIVKQLESDIEKVYKGLDQQAEIVYSYGQKESPVLPTLNHSERIQEFYKNFNTQLANLSDSTDNSLQANNQLLSQRAQAITQKIESLKQCLATKETTLALERQKEIGKLIEQLDKQLLRLKGIKQKFETWNRQKLNPENLTKIMNDINVKLMSQNHYFESLERQAPLLQSASKLLDDYIIRKNTWHERCRDGKCHHNGMRRY